MTVLSNTACTHLTWQIIVLYERHGVGSCCQQQVSFNRANSHCPDGAVCTMVREKSFSVLKERAPTLLCTLVEQWDVLTHLWVRPVTWHHSLIMQPNDKNPYPNSFWSANIGSFLCPFRNLIWQTNCSDWQNNPKVWKGWYANVEWMWYNKNGSEKEDMGVYFICDGATSVIVFVADKMRGPVSLFFTSPLESPTKSGVRLWQRPWWQQISWLFVQKWLSVWKDKTICLFVDLPYVQTSNSWSSY